MAVAQVAVLVPAVAATGRASQLDEAHAAFDQPPREQALLGEGGGHLVRRADAIHPFRRVCLAAHVHQFGHRSLHAIGELVVRDGTLERVEFSETFHDSGVELAHERELRVLQRGLRLSGNHVRHRVRAGLEDRALIRCGEKAAVEVVEAAGRDEPAVEHHEARQVSVLAAETVASPSAHAGPALQAAAGVEEIIRVCVLGEIARHRAHHGEVVHALGDVREKTADGNAALAVLLKLPRRAKCAAVVVELRRLHLHREGLAVLRREPRLRVEGVHLRRSAVHVEEDDGAGACRVVRCARGEGVGRARERFVREQRSEGQRTKAVRATGERGAAGQGAWMETSAVRHGSVEVDELLHVEQHVSEVGPHAIVGGRRAEALGLRGDKGEGVFQL